MTLSSNDKTEVVFSSIPGQGVIYSVIVRDPVLNTSSSYIPVHTYACSFSSTLDGCDTLGKWDNQHWVKRVFLQGNVSQYMSIMETFPKIWVFLSEFPGPYSMRLVVEWNESIMSFYTEDVYCTAIVLAETLRAISVEILWNAPWRTACI